MADTTTAPSADDVLSLTIWGARGSIPAPGAQTLRYGGETTCIEINAGPHVFVVDCGSGVRACGRDLVARGVTAVDVVFTHTHMDHICGLPFFCCAYDPNVEVNCWGGHISGGTFLDIIERLMSPPIFPVATSALVNTHFRQFTGGEPLTLACGLTLRTIRLNHPGNACGYRVDWKGSSIAVVTDHEHGNAEVDEALAAFVDGATLMVYDSMYLDADYPRFVGWGHSTPGRALALAERAGIAIPVLFHHDPNRNDEALDAIAADAAARHPGAIVAREGLTIALANGRRIDAAAAPPG